MHSEQRSYMDVYSDLKNKIRNGSVPAGNPFPSQAELGSQYDVRRHVIRRAIDRLRAEGLVVSWQGRGTYVSNKQMLYDINNRTRFDVNMMRNGFEVRIEIISTKKIRRAPPEVAKLLGLSEREPISFAELLHFVDDVPTIIGRHYFEPRHYSHLVEQITDTQTIPVSFKAVGVEDYTRSLTFVEVRTPTSFEAVNLDVAPSQPVMELRGCNVDDNGMPIEVTEAVVRGDRIRLRI